MGHVQRPTWSGASRPLAECSILTSFTAKVFNIRKDTDGSPPPVFPPAVFNLSTVIPVTSAELRRIILESPPKSCELQPPTYLPAARVRRCPSPASDRALQPLHPGRHPTSVSKTIYSRPSSQVRGTRFERPGQLSTNRQRIVRLENH